MKKLLVLILLGGLMFAQPAMAEVPQPKPNQVVLEIEGVVCSFCAYGMEQKFSKMAFLDTTQFKRGVFTDIDNQVIILAIKEDVPFDVAVLFQAVHDSGYEPSVAHWLEDGEVKTVEAHS